MNGSGRVGWTGTIRRQISELFLWTLFGAGLLVLVFLVSGCGSGGGGGDLAGAGQAEATAQDSGTVVIGLTDADGDFLTYAVDVLSLTLTRADGTVVETLPNSTRVDFAQYTEMTEFVTAATIPAGVYTHATMRLDYSKADVEVERDGEAVPVVLQDAGGSALTTLELTVRFSDRHRLRIAPGIPAHLSLDLDLQASNDVDMTLDPPLVTVEPFLVADVNPERPKIHRVRGPLKNVDLQGDSFEIMIRPRQWRRGDFGSLTVRVDEATAYEIDGETYTGKGGLGVLDEKSSGTAVVAIGRLNMAMRQFEATEVYAGSSVPGGLLDVVTGNITAREGDTLTLRGVTLARTDGTLVFHDDVTVLVGPDTRVVRQALPDDGLGRDDLSVGQRITVFGTLTNQQPGSLELDATAGRVRMLMTPLAGKVVSVASGSLVMELQSISRRSVSIYDFTGTGIDRDHDADPARYEIDTGALDLGSLLPSDPVRVLGFVRSFGEAPDDFEARTVVDLSSVKSPLAVSWKEKGAVSPFLSLSPQGIEVNLDEAELGRFHHVVQGGIVTDLLNLETYPLIQPGDENHGLFAIRGDGVVQVFTVFGDFVQDLQEKLDGSNTMKALFATGHFENGAATLTTGRIAVKIQ